ncbi:MAG: cell envelope integrity protein TolA [Nitrospirae bacterium]|nr:cell envelope integrity protein TolA [Nitrospirota bacterium]
MRGPSLQVATLISTALHLTFFLVAALILRHSRNTIMPSPYEVNLVGPASSTRGEAQEETSKKNEQAARSSEHEKEADRTIQDKKADIERKANALSEIEAKKKIERIGKIRRMITVGSQTVSSPKKLSQRAGSVVGSGRPGGGTYEDLIASRIGQEIVFPETGESQLATIVLVKIRKDGEIIIQGIEKRSGNALFDRAALRAIEKANPVPPPPSEMEVGLTLYPYGTRK